VSADVDDGPSGEARGQLGEEPVMLLSRFLVKFKQIFRTDAAAFQGFDYRVAGLEIWLDSHFFYD
jgi:hypothetical protein